MHKADLRIVLPSPRLAALCINRFSAANLGVSAFGLQWRKGLFTRRPSNNMGEQVSNPRGWDIHGLKKQGGLRCGDRRLEARKGEVSGVLCRRIWLVCSFIGCVFRKWWLAWSEGGVFGLWCQKVIHWTLTQAQVTGLYWFELDKTSSMFLENNLSNQFYSDPHIRGVIYRGWLKESCDILSKLHEAQSVCNLQEKLKWAW